MLDFTTNALIPTYRNDPENAPRRGFRYVAIQVRVCAVSSNIPYGITVSWAPWNLTSKDGDTYQPADSYSQDTLISPLYPDGDKPTAVGQCRKGWIPFAVPNNWKPDVVEYITDFGTLTWQL